MESEFNGNEIPDAYGGESNLTKFFYTSDTTIQKMSDDELFDEILKKYSKLGDSDVEDSAIRRAVIDLLDDERFLDSVMKRLDVTILDIMSMLFRRFSTIFANNQFIRKVKAVVNGKSYSAKYQ